MPVALSSPGPVFADALLTLSRVLWTSTWAGLETTLISCGSKAPLGTSRIRCAHAAATKRRSCLASPGPPRWAGDHQHAQAMGCRMQPGSTAETALARASPAAMPGQWSLELPCACVGSKSDTLCGRSWSCGSCRHSAVQAAAHPLYMVSNMSAAKRARFSSKAVTCALGARRRGSGYWMICSGRSHCSSAAGAPCQRRLARPGLSCQTEGKCLNAQPGAPPALTSATGSAVAAAALACTRCRLLAGSWRGRPAQAGWTA